ncbi:hypothetical protein [Gemella cuniculi]|nr:hypothetical protein [Gemella cuniculi]
MKVDEIVERIIEVDCDNILNYAVEKYKRKINKLKKRSNHM